MRDEVAVPGFGAGYAPLTDEARGFLAALMGDGDSRLAVDARTGVNKYLCPPVPVAEVLCAASCTASPISPRGFAAAWACFREIQGAGSAAARSRRVAAYRDEIAADLLGYFGVAGIAEAILCASGTDAVLATARMVAAEQPGRAMTVILPAAAETGTGVPLAAAGRAFDGVDAAVAPSTGAVRVVEIALRADDGAPLPEDAVSRAYGAAAAAVRGRVVVYLTHGTKTGLIAPVEPPRGVDVIVDACQARIAPATVAAYLRRGWPVVVTGSKFFGGPAFSGAVLFPRERLGVGGDPGLVAAVGEGGCALGTVLRWVAARDEMREFAAGAVDRAALLRAKTAEIACGIAAIPALVPVGGMAARGGGWADLASIFTFAVRDPGRGRQFLSVTELRPVHVNLARRGVLVGQPVGLGALGGLRIALGARDLLAREGFDVARLCDTLRETIAAVGADSCGLVPA
jgi:hypothetical protein